MLELIALITVCFGLSFTFMCFGAWLRVELPSGNWGLGIARTVMILYGLLTLPFAFAGFLLLLLPGLTLLGVDVDGLHHSLPDALMGIAALAAGFTVGLTMRKLVSRFKRREILAKA